MYDLIVIGGGAAGLMAAGTAASRGRSVLLLEKMEKTGRKVRITGKGRCNLTNMRPPEEFAEKVRVNADFFAQAFAEFNNRATVRFFERLGVKLDVERGDRVFPRSGKAWDIAQALVDWCREEGVTVQCETRVTGIMTVGNRVLGVKYENKRGFERKEEAEAVIIATGGVSYPATGSTGDGYDFAAATGHSIEPVRPSLVPLETSYANLHELKGLTLRNVNVQMMVDNELAGEEFGEVSFSDRGIEGAAVLRLSRDAVDALIDERKVKLVLDLKPALTPEQLADRIRREIEQMPPTELFSELLRKLVPRPMVLALAKELDVHSKTYISKVSEKELARLATVLKHYVFPISDYRPFTEAIVTAGGVNCDEVNQYTMESKLIRGLYFAGEVLDLDAATGGYNLQIAFSTGRLAGMLKK
ncbi:MAG: NAD(P)/FAD-dependent oxidoreductase [Rikenellaceae bacterium]|nr:NAD(P)/FAD-dependent oxidoreductase [Rikenellaceae bacterium]